MSFLERLVVRVLNPIASLAPRRTSVFETPAETPAFVAATSPVATARAPNEGQAGLPAARAALAQPSTATPTPTRAPRIAVPPLAAAPRRAERAEQPEPVATASAPVAASVILEFRETMRDIVTPAAPTPEMALAPAPTRQEARGRTVAAATADPPATPQHLAATAPATPPMPAATSLAPPPLPAATRVPGLLAGPVPAARRTAPSPAAPLRLSTPPPVHITIGRIEVRAPPAASAPGLKPARSAVPVPSLADYLDKRGGHG